MSDNCQRVCQQCTEEHNSADTKPIYDEEGEICGHICNPCRLKIAENARRCHIFDCKTRPDSGPTGFRTLPSKFYDLPEGEVKKRIVKQFGIVRNARACCNMCYVRISKAIVQINIVYGGGVLRQSKLGSGKQSLPSSYKTCDSTKAPQAKEDRLSEYTGPKFTRRMGGVQCWNKSKILSTSKNFVDGQEAGVNFDNVATPGQRAVVVDTTPKENNEQKPADIKIDNNSTVKSENGQVWPELNEQADKKPSIELKTEVKVEGEISGIKIDDGKSEQKSVTYSSTPISPTSMRFRRIQPKLPKFEDFDLSDDMMEMETEEQPPGNRNRKRSSEQEDDDFTWSPGGTKREKIESKVKRQKKSVSSEVMSDFVSCMGCRKICSSKEAKPVYDYEKGFCGRLCSDCRIKKREDNKVCQIKGCTTPLNDVVLKPLPPKIHEVSGEARQQLDELGVNKEIKVCCKSCWKKLSGIIASGVESLHNNDDGTEQVFTMCRNCSTIVSINETVPNYEEDGRKCGVLCKSCFSMHLNFADQERKRGQRRKSRGELASPTFKSLGKCKVKGCVNSSSEEPVQLVSGKKILKNYLDEKMLRGVFELDDDTDVCCRSCLARIKWFVADIQKKEGGVGADGKPVNSLKNLTSRVGSEASDKQKSANSQQVTTNETAKTSQSCKPSPITHSSVKITQMLPVKKVIQQFNGNKSNNHSPTNEVGNHISQEDVPQDANTVLMPSSTLSSLSPAAFVIPPASQAPSTPPTSHPPVLQVGGQQFVLNVISRCDKEIQTPPFAGMQEKSGMSCGDKGVQANIPLMPKFEGTVPANLPNGKKVKYTEAKEKTRYAVKRQGKDLFEQFMEQLNDISGGCAQQLLMDIYKPKEITMAANYEKILTSIGTLYHNTDRSNKQERLRLLSTVALHASNETLKRFFQRKSKKGDLISVNEAEIVQAREYAKQFGPGTHVMPVGQVSWRSIVEKNQSISQNDEDSQERESNESRSEPVNGDINQKQTSTDNANSVVISPRENQGLSNEMAVGHKDATGGLVSMVKNSERVDERKLGEQGKGLKVNSSQSKQKRDVVKKRRRTTSSLMAEKIDGKDGIKRRKKLSLDGVAGEKQKKKSDFVKSAIDKESKDVKEKRTRTAFSNEKKDILEKHFQKSIYATKNMVLEISKEVGLDKKKIDNWFRNRRSKLKKDEMDKQLKVAAAKQNNKDADDAGDNKIATDSSSGMSSEETDPSKNDDGDEKMEPGTVAVSKEQIMNDNHNDEVEDNNVSQEKEPETQKYQPEPADKLPVENDGDIDDYREEMTVVEERSKDETLHQQSTPLGEETLQQQSTSTSRLLDNSRAPDDVNRPLEAPTYYESSKTPLNQTVPVSFDKATNDSLIDQNGNQSPYDCYSDHGSLVIAENSDRDWNTDEEEANNAAKMLENLDADEAD